MDEWSVDANAVLRDIAAVAESVRRPDLAEAVARVLASLDDGEATVAVVGGYQQGKTTLVNAILGVDVGATGPDGSTGAVRVLRYGADLPSPLLEDGLVLVDTPGCPGFGGGAVAAALTALPIADAVVVVSSATQPLTAAEVELVATIHRSGRPVLVVKPGADLTRHWPALVAADRDALEVMGAPAPVVAVSCPLRRAAMDLEDDALNEESGVDRVVDWLLDDVAARLADLRRDRVVAEGSSVLASLRDSSLAIRAALDGEAPSDEVVRDLEERARRIAHGASRWGQEMTDAMTDLRGAVEADLKARGNALAKEAEDRLGERDPADGWEAFGGWLEERVAAAMTAHLQWRHERLVQAVERSAASFGELLSLVAPETPAAAVAVDARLAALPKKVSMGSSLYGVLKNSYGGLAMFGFFGGVAGVVLSAPVTIGIGVALGGKGLREERIKQRSQRTAQAVSAARSYIESAWSVFANDARGQLVQLQRAVRDELSSAVDRLRDDTREAHEAARSAAASSRTERQRRLEIIDTELEVFALLAARVDALGKAPVPA